jgi:hypothetical protein
MCYSALALFECFLSGPLVENFVPKMSGGLFELIGLYMY